MRRAISWLYCEPKSRIKTVRGIRALGFGLTAPASRPGRPERTPQDHPAERGAGYLHPTHVENEHVDDGVNVTVAPERIDEIIGDLEFDRGDGFEFAARGAQVGNRSRTRGGLKAAAQRHARRIERRAARALGQGKDGGLLVDRVGGQPR